jgi:SAM-dependent methyltransferase
MSFDGIRSQVGQYYTAKVAAHGATPSGVDWNSAESQRLRFAQLLKVIGTPEPFSINDYGCGYGALADYLQEQKRHFTYCGFDISEKMIALARLSRPDSPQITFVEREDALGVADYTVASGIFNVRLQTPIEDWQRYVLDTLELLHERSRIGFAFNVLTKYSDAELMRPNLYYADPLFLFDHCKKRFSRFVALLHDYPLYEFTLLVRKNVIDA